MIMAVYLGHVRFKLRKRITYLVIDLVLVRFEERVL